MDGIPFRTEQPTRISLYLSKPAPESIFSIDKDGSQIVLLWDYSKKRADVVISDEIPSKIYEYIKYLINKIHECGIKVEGYFHIGVDYTVIKSPYIYRFRLIEGLEEFKDDKKYPQIKTESDPTRLFDIPPEGFIPELAEDTDKTLNEIMKLGDERYYIGEKFTPSYSTPYEPSYVRDEENFIPSYGRPYAPSYVRDEENFDPNSVNAYLGKARRLEDQPERDPTRLFDIPPEGFIRGYETFIPSLASSYNYQLNNLMDQEDQDYYLGEQWFPPYLLY